MFRFYFVILLKMAERTHTHTCEAKGTLSTRTKRGEKKRKKGGGGMTLG